MLDHVDGTAISVNSTKLLDAPVMTLDRRDTQRKGGSA